MLKVAFLATDCREQFKDYSAAAPCFNAGVEALMDGLSACNSVEIHVISCLQEQVSSPEKLAGMIWYHGLHVPKIGWARTLFQGCIRAVRHKLNELQPDLVHGYGTERDCAICAALSGFPNVVSIQGNMVEIARRFRAPPGSYFWLMARLENFTLKRTAGVICNSRYTQNLVASRTPKSWIVHPALRRAFMAPIPAGPRPCLLLNAGVISTRKRQLELLEVAESLHRQGLKLELQFIGSADTPGYFHAFHERIKPMAATGFARYLGHLPDAELLARFDSVSGMIHFPSEEAFGLNVAEALARNLKVFGTRLGGIIDIAEGVPGADLFEPDDWAGLTAALANWIKQGHPRPQEAAAVMRERYHPEAVARRHLEVYRELISSASPKGLNQ